MNKKVRPNWLFVPLFFFYSFLIFFKFFKLIFNLNSNEDENVTGAGKRGWTSMDFSTRPWTVRVCQFRHARVSPPRAGVTQIFETKW